MNSFTKTTCVQCKVYYGSEERMGMCSVCFKENKNKEAVKTETNQVQPTLIIPATEISVNPVSEDVKMEEPTVEEKVLEKVEEKVEVPVTKPVQTNMHACWICNKKVGYLGFKCKCEYIFCGSHRHFSDHNCEFDHKSYDREKLVKKSNFGTEMK